jgi:hypothetical protein
MPESISRTSLSRQTGLKSRWVAFKNNDVVAGSSDDHELPKIRNAFLGSTRLLHQTWQEGEANKRDGAALWSEPALQECQSGRWNQVFRYRRERHICQTRRQDDHSPAAIDRIHRSPAVGGLSSQREFGCQIFRGVNFKETRGEFVDRYGTVEHRNTDYTETELLP